MLRNAVARTVLNLFLGYALGFNSRAADVDSTPVRQFGLGTVSVLAVSPDQRFLATGGQGGAFFWDLQTGTLLDRLETEWSVTALAFSPDSQTLLAASRASIFSWKTDSRAPHRAYHGHQGEIARLHFAADGQSFVSASADNAALLWHLETGDPLHAFRTPGAPILAAAISPDGRRLATADSFFTNSVKIWDIASETQLQFLPRTNWTADRLLFTPAGQLVTAASDRSVLLWDIDSGQLIRAFEGIGSPTINLLDLWMPDASTLAAAGNDGRIFAWNIETGANLPTTPGKPILTARGLPGTQLVVNADSDSLLHLRELGSGRSLRTFAGHTTSTHSALSVSPDGRFLLSAGTESATRLWDRQTAAPVRNYLGNGSGSMAAAFSTDGSQVLTTIGLPQPGALLWNAQSGELLRKFEWTASWPMSAALSRDANRVAAGAQDGRIRLFDAGSGALLRTLTASGWVRALAFAPTAPLLASGSSDSTAALYNHETGQRLHTFEANAGAVVTVAFSPNGQTLLIAWADGLIRLYHSLTMELRREFFVNAGFLLSAAFSPDGQFLLTGEGWPAFTATLWDAQTAQTLRVFQGHRWEVGAVAFSPDGASVFTAADYMREWSIADFAARLRLESRPEGLRLSWAFGQLQHAPTVAGPWQNVSGAASPLTIPPAAPAGFYRVDTGTLRDPGPGDPSQSR